MGTKNHRTDCEPIVGSGGARRDRTVDLLHAMQALSQLSYGPVEGRAFSGTRPVLSTTVRRGRPESRPSGAADEHFRAVGRSAAQVLPLRELAVAVVGRQHARKALENPGEMGPVIEADRVRDAGHRKAPQGQEVTCLA